MPSTPYASGAVTPLPKFAPSKTRQVVESECRAYADLATAYATHSAEKLRKVLDTQGPAFTQVRQIPGFVCGG